MEWISFKRTDEFQIFIPRPQSILEMFKPITSTSSSLISSIKEAFDELRNHQKPYPMITLMKLSSLCVELKAEGHALDTNNPEDMEKIKDDLIKYCQDPGITQLELRLQMLEIIELRELGWKTNKGMEEFYFERFNEAREVAARNISNIQNNASASSEASPRVPLIPISRRPQTSGITDRDVVRKQMTIGRDKLILESANSHIVQIAKQQLETFFSRNNNVTVNRQAAAAGDMTNNTINNPTTATTNVDRLEVNYQAPDLPSASLKYSREALLTLATKPQAQVIMKG